MQYLWREQRMYPTQVKFNIVFHGIVGGRGMQTATVITEPHGVIWKKSDVWDTSTNAVLDLSRKIDGMIRDGTSLQHAGLERGDGDENRTRIVEWTDQENAAVVELRNRHNGSHEDIAIRLYPRTEVAVAQQYSLLVRRGAPRNMQAASRWTVEEDEVLVNARYVLGLSFQQVAARLPGRTRAACQSRFQDLARMPRG